MKSESLRRILAEHEITLNLVDVGASLEMYKPFKRLSSVARYIGFDPDERETGWVGSSAAGDVVFIKSAVSDVTDDSKQVLFLTRNPTCSSLLDPNSAILENYSYRDQFTVIAQEEVNCTNLSCALNEIGSRGFYWLKVDTQGKDLAVIKSLSDDIMNNTLCIDVEPGFDEFYINEDQFVDTHSYLLEKGFWLADLSCIEAPRIKCDVYDKYFGTSNVVTKFFRELTSKRSPVAASARYLRATTNTDTQAKLIALWVFAYYTSNLLFALELADRLEQMHIGGTFAGQLLAESRKAVTLNRFRHLNEIVTKISLNNLKRIMRLKY